MVYLYDLQCGPSGGVDVGRGVSGLVNHMFQFVGNNNGFRKLKKSVSK